MSSDLDDELLFGGGVDYEINSNFSARVEYNFAGDLETFAFGVKYSQ